MNDYRTKHIGNGCWANVANYYRANDFGNYYRTNDDSPLGYVLFRECDLALQRIRVIQRLENDWEYPPNIVGQLPLDHLTPFFYQQFFQINMPCFCNTW